MAADLERLRGLEQEPEISLPKEHERQSLILAKVFAKRLGMSDRAYIATLPQFSDRPSSYENLGLTVPLIIETRLPWTAAAQLSGIDISHHLRLKTNKGEVKDWEEGGLEMSGGPFTVWAQDGTKFVYRKPSDVRRELLEKDENREYSVGSIYHGIALWNAHPDMVRKMFWDLIGTQVGSHGVSSLLCRFDQPKLHAYDADSAFSLYRAFICGREVGT